MRATVITFLGLRKQKLNAGIDFGTLVRTPRVTTVNAHLSGMHVHFGLRECLQGFWEASLNSFPYSSIVILYTLISVLMMPF